MFEVEHFMHKPFIDREPLPGHAHNCHEKPRYTMTEEVEHATRLMRETIDRLLRFENRLKDEFAKLSKTLSSDNVIFKNTMFEGWNTFLMEVKNEINIFESTTSAEYQAFKAEIESNYATLSEDVRKQISDNISDYENKLSDLSTEIQEQYNSFVNAVNSRIEQNNATHEDAFADFQRQITTQLNTFEQTVNAQIENFIESVNTTLHTFKEAWEATITTRLANQDAKLDDAEMYMKSNLTATVTTLIGDMHANGEFQDIIEGEVFNDLSKTVKSFDAMSVKYFGAKGDGVSDDTLAFIRATNLLGDGFSVLTIPEGVYCISDEIPVASKRNVKIIGINNPTIKAESQESVKSIFKVTDYRNVEISGIHFESVRDKTGNAPNGHIRVNYATSNIQGVSANGGENLKLLHNSFDNMENDYWLTANANENVVIDGWVSRNASMPTYSSHLENAIIRNADLIPSPGMGSGDHAIYISANSDGVLIENVKVDAPDKNFGVLFTFHDANGDADNQPKNIVIRNVNAKGCRFLFAYPDVNEIVLDRVKFVQTFSEYAPSYNNGTYTYTAPTNVVTGCSVLKVHNCEFTTMQGAFVEDNGRGMNIEIDNCTFDINDAVVIGAKSKAKIRNSVINCKHINYTNGATEDFYLSVMNCLVGSSEYVFTRRNSNKGNVLFANNVFQALANYPFIYNGDTPTDGTGVLLLNNAIKGYTRIGHETELANATIVNSELISA